MDSKIGFEMSLIVVEAITWTTCEFCDSNGNGFGDIWWTDRQTHHILVVCCSVLYIHRKCILSINIRHEHDRANEDD